MKRAHEELVESTRSKITQAKEPSILALIVRELSSTRFGANPAKVTLPFTIDEKSILTKLNATAESLKNMPLMHSFT
jgi:hypothetical protein